ncbi:MAG: hypothetical protein EKK37_13055 [Sphingobacteriales bacterium]|nr:MAG: hypothetical protein EKK37_13055 [Sphingobacteriales bacterium]
MKSSLIKIFFTGILIFVIITFISYVQTKESSTDFKLGWPWVFYEQFQISGNIGVNHGTDAKDFIYDYAISIVLSIFLFSVIDISKRKS